jgi:plastocyanin
MRAVRRIGRALGVGTLALGITATALSVPAAARDEIVISAAALEPPALETVVGHRVTFVNRSGHIVHVEFPGDRSQHYVFQVPGEIWAVFHRPGRHPYVVHFSGDESRGLSGAVEVADDPSAGPHTCSGLTVMGTCIEP